MSEGAFRVADDIRMAKSMSVAHCACGAVFFRLHDAEGVIFAAGSMSADTAAVFVGSAIVEIEAAVASRKAGDLATMKCEGCA